MTTPLDDGWRAGDLYEPYVGRWSRQVADRFLAWLGPPRRRAWVDVGCGTGALTEAIVARAEPSQVHAIEPSSFIEYARRRVRSPVVRFHAGDARALPLPATDVDLAVSGLVLNFVPEPAEALREMKRVTREGGTIAAYVWDYAEGMQLMRYFWDAAAELDDAAKPLDEGRRFPLCRPEPLARLFEDAGLANVEVTPIEIATPFRNFDDYWTPFLGGQGPAPAYAMALDEERRRALRERLRERVPVGTDGAIDLTARAWAVRGTAAPGR